jgi:hypothetical protein
MQSKPTDESIGLAELIYEVKRELLNEDGVDKDPVPLFAVDSIELEVAVSVSREGKAGVNIQVLNVGGGASREDAQTVRVTLKPLYSRVELLERLRERKPMIIEEIVEDAVKTLKGDQSSPPSWP